MFGLTKPEFQYGIQIYYKFDDLSHLVCREIRKSELQVQFINIASSKTRQLIEKKFAIFAKKKRKHRRS